MLPRRSKSVQLRESSGKEKARGSLNSGLFAYLDASNEGIGYVTEEGHHQMSDDTVEKVAEAFAAMQNGDVTVPADATVNEYTPEDFPMN